MAEAKATFTAELQDQMSAPARAAASGIEKLKATMQAQQAELRALTNAQKVMNQGTVVNVAEHKRLQERIQTVKNSLASNQSHYLKAGGSLTDLSKKTVEQKNHTNDLIKKFDKWGVTSDKASASQNLAAIGAAGLAAAVVAVEVAAVAATVALVSFAIKAADAARTAHLMMIGFAGGASNADALGMQIDQLARKLPQTRAELREIAKTLAGEGIQGNALVDSTKAIATISAAMGSGAASKLQSIISRAQLARRFIIGAFDLRGAGISIDDIAAKLATQMKTSTQAAKQALMTGGVAVADGLKAMNSALDAKFGNTVQALSRSLPTLKAKAEEALGQLFAGIDIEPLLKGLAGLEHMLEGNTVTGKALKQILTTAVQPLINGLAKAAPIAKAVFLGFLIGVVYVEIALVKLHTKLKQLIPPDLRPKLDNTNTAMKVGAMAAGALAGGIALVAAACLLAVGIMALPFIILGLAIYFGVKLVTKAVGVIKGAANAVVSFISGLASDMASAASDFIDGLVQGIKDGAIKVAEAAKAMATGAVDAVKSTLHINSPSKVMMSIGEGTAEGFRMGVEDGTPKATAAMTDLVAPQGASGKPMPAMAGRGHSPVSITFAPGSIVIGGVANSRELVAELRQPLTALLQEVVNGSGLAAA